MAITELSDENETIKTSSAGMKHSSASIINTMLNIAFVAGFTRMYFISAAAFSFLAIEFTSPFLI